MDAGTQYRVEADNSGVAYSAVRRNASPYGTIPKENITYVTGSLTASDNSPYNILSITTRKTEIKGVYPIGNISENTRVWRKMIGNNVPFSSINFMLQKFVSPGVDLKLRIENMTG